VIKAERDCNTSSGNAAVYTLILPKVEVEHTILLLTYLLTYIFTYLLTYLQQ